MVVASWMCGCGYTGLRCSQQLGTARDRMQDCIVHGELADAHRVGGNAAEEALSFWREKGKGQSYGQLSFAW